MDCLRHLLADIWQSRNIYHIHSNLRHAWARWIAETVFVMCCSHIQEQVRDCKCLRTFTAEYAGIMYRNVCWHEQGLLILQVDWLPHYKVIWLEVMNRWTTAIQHCQLTKLGLLILRICHDCFALKRCLLSKMKGKDMDLIDSFADNYWRSRECSIVAYAAKLTSMRRCLLSV